MRLTKLYHQRIPDVLAIAAAMMLITSSAILAPDNASEAPADTGTVLMASQCEPNDCRADDNPLVTVVEQSAHQAANQATRQAVSKGGQSLRELTLMLLVGRQR